MMREWGGRYREEYCNLWHQMSEMGGITTIRYNNTEIYERVPEHLMKDLDVQQGRMWIEKIAPPANQRFRKSRAV